MFSHIAAGYEGFDHLASLGQDLLWRPRALWTLDRFHQGPVARALDVGCGTGELARAVARHFPAVRVVATDFTARMLRTARRHRGADALEPRMRYAAANTLRLPFPDGAFDLVTNAFVLRNLSDLAAAFREMRRVLRPGGTLLSLEITEPTARPFGTLFHAYFDHVVPMLGRAAGSEGPYRYLPESLRTLPSRTDLEGILRSCGFPRTWAAPQSLGIVTTFLGAADGR